eukprot:GHVU01198504.1.p1 GENE.GHVU01198504.1~~GHVU01198504.1.p1  ORF type:complete len:411 (-),score=27.72 GHVU01198504.1:2165-3397(-)
MGSIQRNALTLPPLVLLAFKLFLALLLQSPLSCPLKPWSKAGFESHGSEGSERVSSSAWMLGGGVVVAAASTNARFHSAGDGPCGCSRAASRWTRLGVRKGFLDKVTKAAPDYALPSSCPLNPVKDMYLAQELKKRVADSTNTQAGGWVCAQCGAKFHTEFELDLHMDRLHTHESVKASREDAHVVGARPLRGEATGAEAEAEEEAIGSPDATVCLEKFCPIFDSCNGPPNTMGSAEHMPNPLSVRRQSGTCDGEGLRQAYESCLDIVDACLPLASQRNDLRRLNVETKKTLCTPLSSCATYTRRRSLPPGLRYNVDAVAEASKSSYQRRLFDAGGPHRTIGVVILFFCCILVLAAVVIIAFVCMRTADKRHSRRLRDEGRRGGVASPFVPYSVMGSPDGDAGRIRERYR